MRRLAVVSYPELAARDRQWIESLRAEHDPLAGKIGAHITLVFPVQTTAETMSNEIAAIAAAQTRVEFTLGSVEAVRDAFGPGGHVFLVLADGRDAIAEIHDRLYASTLRPHLRADIPYIPHITVASHDDFGHCAALADRVRRDLPVLQGAVRILDLIDVDREPVESVERFGFGPDLLDRYPVYSR